MNQIAALFPSLIVSVLASIAGISGQAAVIGALTPPVPKQLPPPLEYRENSPKYPYIDPLIAVETDQRYYTQYDNLDMALNFFITAAKKTHKADSVSVYVRDENSGAWTGVNEDVLYEPSSMLKVPVMISYIRYATTLAAESSTTVQSVLAQQLYFTGTDISGVNYPPENIVPAGMYSAQDLIDMMIKDSDNVAAETLLAAVPDEFRSVFDDFHLPQAATSTIGSDFMTARSYAIIFRSLYNASYLSQKQSSQALELLTQTSFDKGIVAGVPAGTAVAHKFGEHTNLLYNKLPVDRELHDCGIVYYPKHPYLLCVMTKGQSFTDLEGVISNISAKTWDYVSRQYPM